jgi:MFS family permease
VLAGAGTAAAGCLLLALSSAAAPAAVGLVVATGGIAMTWPLLLAEASAGRTRPAMVVGAVSTVGYLGFVVGPSLVGLVAGRAGLRWGLVLLAGAAAFVALAPYCRQHSGQPPDRTT